MVRTLAKIAGVSAVIAVVCLALAIAIGGPDLRKNGFSFDDGSWQSDGDHGKAGIGNLRDHSNFTSLDVGGGIEASVTIGPAFKVEIMGEHPEQVVTRQQGTELKVRPRGHFFWWGKGELPAVHIIMPSVAAVRSSAGAEVTATGIAADNLSLTASSGAQIHAAGTCKALALKASSGAELDAGDLACEAGRADASSGSSLKVRVNGKFDLDASSGADVTNLGASTSGDVSLNSGATLHKP